MIGIKRSLVMLAAGAALAVGGSLSASAAPVSSIAPSMLSPSGPMVEKGLTEVRKRRGYRGHRGYRRHGRRGRGRSHIWWGAPLLAAPFLYHGYSHGYGGYGYDGRNYCYRECRYYHGPRYCSRYWRRFC